MSLSQIVINAVKTAREQAGDLLVKFTVENKTGSTYYNGQKTSTYDPVIVDGVYDKFDINEIDGKLIQVTDVKIVLFIDRNEQLPKTDSRVSVGTEVYNVMRCWPIYCGDKVVVSTVQLRK